MKYQHRRSQAYFLFEPSTRVGKSELCPLIMKISTVVNFFSVLIVVFACNMSPIRRRRTKPKTATARGPTNALEDGTADIFRLSEIGLLQTESGVAPISERDEEFRGTGGRPGENSESEDEVKPRFACPPGLDKWNTTIFGIDAKNVLVIVTYCAIRGSGLLRTTTFDLNERKLINYLQEIQSRYHPNPYHNQIHGADVVRTAYVILLWPRLQNTFTDLERLAILLAAAGHDADHPGLTNKYLNATNHPWVQKYGSKSTLEHHHLDVTLESFNLPDADVLSSFSQQQVDEFKRLVTHMILATDNADHKTLLEQLTKLVNAKKGSVGSLQFGNQTEKQTVMNVILHLSDISNPLKPIDTFRNWTDRIMEEFWRQGDKEKEIGIPVSELCDRDTTDVPKSQLGFMNFLVKPFLDQWALLVKPDAQPLLDQFSSNLAWWKEKITTTTRSSTFPETSQYSSTTSDSRTHTVLASAFLMFIFVLYAVL